MTIPSQLVWQRPSRIPWDQVDSHWASDVTAPNWTSTGDVNKQWAEWASTFEDSLQGHVQHQPGLQLQKAQKGRLQTTHPQKRPPHATVLKPSRPSEVQLRNDLIGTETKLWFRQLRRLQSYHAAIKANKLTCHAVAYRLELWMAIKKSPGFLDGFSTWWTSHRIHSLPETPPILPVGPPDEPMALAIFATFKCNFEHFEQWHLRQRGKLLKLKYDKGMQGIFQDLKPPQRDKLDLLLDQKSYMVLAVEPQEQLLHLDSPVLQGGHSQWTHDGATVSTTIINEVVIQVPDVSQFSHGDALQQYLVISDTHELHQQLLDYWKPTWCAMSTADPQIWHRVVSFFHAYVPSFRFEIEPISADQWRQALRRYKPHAARGVDGVSHLDLLALPMEWTQRLLDLLHAIEIGVSTWPTALLYGVVSVLAKDDNASKVSRFRPIVIFSIIYRTWASLRSKQLLRQLAPHMDVEAFGFLPGCEPTQLWLLLQAEVEVSLQSNSPLCGLSSDLTRAFNFIPRQHTFALATHLGVPMRIVHPWRTFLNSCTRAFEVRGVLSEATASTCGLPEGDALSVYGMTQLCFAWHLYMRAYSPSVRSLSFVDNLSLLAGFPGDLARGLACLIEFFKLWNLATDAEKSYCWALHPTDRAALQQVMPFQRVDHAHELGGVLSFTKRKFTGLQQRRIAQLPSKWKRLQQSLAPIRLKLAVLPSVFWSSALYGINGSCLGETHIDRLRSQALRSLRLAHAGVNAHLRLGLSSTPSADPGYWRLRMTVRSFVRLLRKEPRLLGLWKTFMLGFDGNVFSGPFSQLLLVLNQISWRIEPPFLVDHDHCFYDLTMVDYEVFDEPLYDAWLQYIASLVSKRKTMLDLRGLDPALLLKSTLGLTSLQRSLVDALRSGAFMDRSSQSKFDLTKMALCSQCGVEDNTLHWLECPRYASLRAQMGSWQNHHSMDSKSLKAHLLPSRSPFAGPWKQALMMLPSSRLDFLSSPSTGLQHVFTDGSATSSLEPFGIAAWGCLNANTGQLISIGHVSGLQQTSDRAELEAIVSSLEWQHRFQVPMHLWIDSKFVADGLLYLLTSGVTGTWRHFDLWQRAGQLVHQLGQLELVPHWIPSHLDQQRLECPFEDWVKEWNDKIDAAVGHFNLMRPPDFQTLRTDAKHHHSLCTDRLHQLRDFYFAVAHHDETDDTEWAEGADVSLFGFVDEPQYSFNDLYIPPLEGFFAGIGFTA